MKISRIIDIFLSVVIGIAGIIYLYNKYSGQLPRKADSDQWQKLNLILKHIEKNYVDTLDYNKMTEAAIVAALEKLDPHSVYIPPVKLEEMEQELEGNFDGIGIQFNVPNDTVVVLEVISGGPSEKAGLKQGDRIVKVGDKVIAGVNFPQDSMVRRMKGKAGTEVDILVKRGGEEIPFKVTRGKIPVHCVDAAFMVDSTTGYIRLAKFTRTTFMEVTAASGELLKQGMTHLIFDLRGNSGGFFDQSLLLSNMFLEKGREIVYIKGLHREKETYTADGTGSMLNVKLSVLIDESSASSSEIFAGAIQDNDRGLIYGRRSFGKGLVQEPLHFTDNSAIRLTVARFHTPSGRCIQKSYEDYDMDIYNRFAHGELYNRDSIKVDTSDVYFTVSGRKVYGGGGIIPDVFVPIDTTTVTDFYYACSKKATPMRFAASMYDKYTTALSSIDDFDKLLEFLDKLNIKSRFIDYAYRVDGISIKKGEWEASEPYLMPLLRAMIGRYSKLSNNAFQKLYMDVDEVCKEVMRQNAEEVMNLNSIEQ